MSDDLPLVSIVTVVFNVCKAGRQEFLRQSIASVMAQDYPRIEHIVIDGASADGTLELLRQYEQAGSVKVWSEPDSGIFNAMNKGLARACGKYVAYLNSDDFYSDHQAVSKAVAALEGGKADFTFAPCYLLHEDGSRTFSPLYLNRVFNVAPCYHLSVFAKKDILDDMGGFNEEYRMAADSDLITRMLLAGHHPAILRDAFATFRLGGVSVDAEKCRQECVTFFTAVFCKYAGITCEQAAAMVWSDYVPKQVLVKFAIRGDRRIAWELWKHRLARTPVVRALRWLCRLPCRLLRWVGRKGKSAAVRLLKAVLRPLYRFYVAHVKDPVMPAPAASPAPLCQPHPALPNLTIGASSILLPMAAFRNPHGNRVKIGEDCILANYFIFESDQGEIEIGNRVFINGQTQLISRSRITIEDNVTIAWGCMIYDHNSHSLDPALRRKDMSVQLQDFRQCGDMIRNKDWSVVKAKPIKICRDAWLGFNVTVLAGSTIGEGAVIGAQSVVRGDIPPFAIAYGNPAQVVGYVRR